jgi:hypothetical protein
MATPSAEFLAMLTKESYETLVARLKAHKYAMDSTGKRAEAIQAEINKRESAKLKQEKAHPARLV